MKARADGEDWRGLEETAKEFRKLTPRDTLEGRLNRLVEEAERQETERKVLIITKHARNQVDDTKALIGRYLDDEQVRSYEDAVQRAKAEAAAPKPKAKGAAAPKAPKP